MVLPLLFTLVVSPRAQAQPKPLPKGPPVLLGVVDETKLAQSRSDFPSLVTQVLPQVAAKRHLSLVVTRQGWKWGQSKVASVDVTEDAMVLLRNLPLTSGAFSGQQQGAARHALDALSALDVALRVGNLSYAAYNERLTNTSIAFDAALKGVPESALKARLLRAMQSFLDVRTAWDADFETIKRADEAIEAENKGLLGLFGQAIYEKQRPQLEKDDEAKREKVRQEAFQLVLTAKEKPPYEVEAADRLLSITFPK